MAPLAAVVVALARSAARSFRSVGSLTGNNLFAIVVLLMAEEPLDRPSSTAIFYLVIGILFAIPITGDLYRRIPAERMQLWPLKSWERGVIYGCNLLLNPLLLLAILFSLLSRHPAVGLGVLLAAIIAPIIAFLVRHANTKRSGPRIPRFPGAFGSLIQNHVRELLQQLDFWFAATLAAGGVLARVLIHDLDPAAALVIGQLVVALLGTTAQCNGSFDALNLQTRLRLLPVTGVQILLARDAAWLSVAAVLIAPFPLAPTVGAAISVAAIGHSQAGRAPVEQRRWNFATGRLGPTGILQIVAGIATSAVVIRFGAWILLPILVLYAVTLWWYGRKWDEAG
ncbi:MAG: hypothetical protein H7039_04945 [Bryobacteraceae bacterium]|nr:hypothetical protein [Bryobacteraceae bacterium]